MPGWPVDVAAALAAHGQHFNAPDQNQRGALAILDGRVYVPYGGHFGDCGDYRGWVVGVGLRPSRRHRQLEHPRAGRRDLGAGRDRQRRAVIVRRHRQHHGCARSGAMARRYFAWLPTLPTATGRRIISRPSDWRALDQRDADLGGTNPLPLNLPAATRGARALVLALGKDARAYLLDRGNLGGIGGSLLAETVATGPIRTAPSAYPAADGVFVAFEGHGAHCPAPRHDNALTVLKIGGGSPPALATAWCGALSGGGSPIVTTTDGRANPIVWILGAEGDNRLHGYRGDTGEPLFDGGGPGDKLAGLHHFQDLAAGRRPALYRRRRPPLRLLVLIARSAIAAPA